MNIEAVDALVFDFDGVLTDNRVFVDQDGKESVCCNRSDGLAFEALKKIIVPVFILSTESNPVVVARAQKLKIPVLHGIKDKKKALQKLCSEKNFTLAKILFVGNDLNDYAVMTSCGHCACPADAHIKIKEISKFVLLSVGGGGVVRELLESIFNLDLLKILYEQN